MGTSRSRATSYQIILLLKACGFPARENKKKFSVPGSRFQKSKLTDDQELRTENWELRTEN
jgi:hypothetical protein